ncbi:MAG: alpha-glucosidase [Christensenellales bacterium]|jgi:alpha-glucosidase
MKIVKEYGNYKLIFNGLEIFSHSASFPFVKVGMSELTFSDNRGSFKIKERAYPEHSLDDIKYESNAGGLNITFSGNGVKVMLKCAEKDGTLTIKLDSEGDFNKITFNLSGAYDEKIFGLGERFVRLNHKNRTLANFVSEHINVKSILKKTIPPFKWISKPSEEVNTYAPMTSYMSDKGYMVRIDADGYAKFRFENDINSLTFYGLPRSICVYTGNSYKEISRIANSARPYLPEWVHDGMILGIQGGIDVAVKKAYDMIDRGVKISGVWCQDWCGKKITVAGKQVYWNWEADNTLYPDLRTKIIELNKRGVKFLAYINPYLVEGSPMFNELRDKGYLIKDLKGSVYLFKTTTFPAAMMDLTNPGMISYLKDIVIKKNMLDIGISGFMADFGEYLPAGVSLHNEEPSSKMHNIWPVLWAKYVREAIEEAGKADEVFFFTRSAYNGAEKYIPVMWNGDQHTDYSIDYGMPCVIPATLNLGMSGMPLVHSDIGGYITFMSLKRDAELFIRWMSMNAFSPMMRTHETPRPEINAQFDSPEVIKYSVYYTNIHYMLKPYIISVIEDAKKGVPAMRAPFYNYDDLSCYAEDYSYMLGDDLFVAPVIEAGAEFRSFTLPKDNWVNLFTGKTNKGGKLTAKAPLNAPPVYYREKSEYKKLFESITAYINSAVRTDNGN